MRFSKWMSADTWSVQGSGTLWIVICFRDGSYLYINYKFSYSYIILQSYTHTHTHTVDTSLHFDSFTYRHSYNKIYPLVLQERLVHCKIVSALTLFLRLSFTVLPLVRLPLFPFTFLGAHPHKSPDSSVPPVTTTSAHSLSLCRPPLPLSLGLRSRISPKILYRF